MPYSSVETSPPDRLRARRRLRGILGLGLLTGLGFAGYHAWRGHYFETELQTSREEVAAGHFPGARERLIKLARMQPGHPSVEYGLGLCEQAVGKPELAFEAWDRVPAGSKEYFNAALDAGRLAMQLGHYEVAETRFRRALKSHDTETQQKAYKALGYLFQVEGRNRDVRRLIEESGDYSSWALTTLASLDFEPSPIETIREALEKASKADPNDDRVWLGLASLALRNGEIDKADELLKRCENVKPNDEVVAMARLDWALAANRPDEAARTLRKVPAKSLSLTELASLTAWFARHERDLIAELKAINAALALEPGRTELLEREAELEFAAGRLDEVKVIRDRKAKIDESREKYRRLLSQAGTGKVDPAEAARLADELGRYYEARGWANKWMRSAPPLPEAQKILDRLARLPSSTPKTNRSSADVLMLPATLGVSRPDGAKSPNQRGAASTIRFSDDGERMGLTFRFDNGRSPERQLPETMSGGVGLLDFDGDGWLDVYVIQGGPFPPPPGFKGDRLFRNRRDGTFEDATASAGIDQLPQGYGHGVIVGDYDNDGDPDLFITRWRAYSLYRNDNGRFIDVTEEAGLGGDRDWPTSAAFVDLDGDGDQDLYVCHYLVWDAQNPRPCKRHDTGERSYCTPGEQPALPDHLFRNDGGRFVDVSESAGITRADTDGRGLGVIAAQLDEDLAIDLYVANDMSANFLFQNKNDWKFEEIGLASGTAGNAEGGWQAGMGLACGDLDGDGRVDLAVTNFYGEGTTLYHNLGQGSFTDRSRESGLWVASRYRLGFGIAFSDLDNDGRLDVVTANGHVNDLKGLYPYAMPTQVMWNLGNGRLQEVASPEDSPLNRPLVGRGLATGDLDNDGRMDVVILCQNEPLLVLHNQTEPMGHWASFRLEGTKSNRDAIGAIVAVKSGGRTRVLQRFGGGSYQSSIDPRLHVGLKDARLIESVEIRWPSGQVDRYQDLKADTRYLIREGDPTPRIQK